MSGGEWIYKNDDEALLVMSRAIRKHFNDDEEKINTTLARHMAEIVTDGFLSDALKEQNELIKQNKEFIKNLKKEISSLIYSRDNLRRELVDLKAIQRIVEEKIKSMDGQTIGEREINPMLAGAKKAYDWIYEKTNDENRACKAYNSYLLGGKYVENDVYDGDVKTFDASLSLESGVCTYRVDTKKNNETGDLSVKDWKKYARSQKQEDDII